MIEEINSGNNNSSVNCNLYSTFFSFLKTFLTEVSNEVNF